MVVEILSTILGGIIAGGIGLLTARHQIRKQVALERENWTYQLYHLCRRLSFEYGAPERAAVETIDEQNRDMTTANLLVPELERHLGRAPVRISREVRDAQEELLAAYTRLSYDSSGEIATVNRLIKVGNAAERIANGFELEESAEEGGYSP